MTPERKKYLARMGKEEREIRWLIVKRRDEIHLRKAIATKYKSESETCLRAIKNNKIQISVLKRQLPAPLKSYLDERICCRCGMHYHRRNAAGMFYCSRCGQAINPESW